MSLMMDDIQRSTELLRRPLSGGGAVQELQSNPGDTLLQRNRQLPTT